MIPTTSGTGSEVSEGTIFIDEALQSKILVLGLEICPTIALTDPEMVKTMPPNVTVNSGVDALVHAIESYTSMTLITQQIAVIDLENTIYSIFFLTVCCCFVKKVALLCG